MNWESIAFQIPLVAAFIWFALETQKRQSESASRHHADWREYMKTYQETFLRALKDQSRLHTEEMTRLWHMTNDIPDDPMDTHP